VTAETKLAMMLQRHAFDQLTADWTGHDRRQLSTYLQRLARQLTWAKEDRFNPGLRGTPRAPQARSRRARHAAVEGGGITRRLAC
jgi:dTDP-D-glucose 4,6-dehydratase